MLAPDLSRGSLSERRRDITCIVQATLISSTVPGKSKVGGKRRSGCPVSISLEILGDRWSLLIVRDLMVRGHKTYKQFLQAGEGIASNILADRLKRLEAAQLITAELEEADRRRVNYRLTAKGMDLAPVLLELLIWGARHEQTGAPNEVIDQMEKQREAVLAETRQRWEQRDSTPILPSFAKPGSTERAKRRKA